ncbi:Pectin lyase fold/virulence factor [Pseudocohnilembus persalinus]|uniref:Pectin lyase fold/virulence factor n=1 Tax=Pseudocohnilembus persalinus TaxID=266149 RepID=A0A0V0QVT0_PSEPJ|nr:Pectin lyase fold/virulence factor [Pseudocohnilembus persalinus]|eukprot:KRX06112.1 Pectin lyase fold/virulence factor [Pseudocohnilembus persalinus]
MDLNENVLIDNFTANSCYSQIQGAGIYALYLYDLKIINSFFVQNEIENNGAGIAVIASFYIQIINNQFIENIAYLGAGLNIFISEYITIKNNLFYKNFALQVGGGMTQELCYDTQIINNKFQYNYSKNEGGAIGSLANYNYTVENCIFIDNQSIEGGSISIIDYSTEEITQYIFFKDLHFENNYAFEKGGAIEIKGGAIFIQFTMKTLILNSLAEQNYVNQNGGLICIQDSQQLILQSNTILNNTAFYGGAIYMFQLDNFTMDQTQIQNNQALVQGGGGGIFIEAQDKDVKLIFENLEFDGNKALSGTSLCILSNNKDQIDIKQFQNVTIQNDHGYLGLIRYLGPNQNLKNKLIIEEKNNKLIYYPENRTDESIYNCVKCYENTVCPGQYQKNYPQKGYWRENQDTYEYIQCKNDQSQCLGNDTCAEGYTGVLCDQQISCNIYAYVLK